MTEEHDSYDTEIVGYFLRWHNKSKRLAWIKLIPIEMLPLEEEEEEVQ